MLFSGLASVRMMKNCDLGLENAAGGHPKPANHIYFCSTNQCNSATKNTKDCNKIHLLYLLVASSLFFFSYPKAMSPVEGTHGIGHVMFHWYRLAQIKLTQIGADIQLRTEPTFS